ncbi:AMP-binding protein [Streptomyces sp. NPDC059788]|uniref:AMP-binding protein n=1 Tax=Streptomyces sp. NPDC059788 TaxID=3346948 RepID=UPI003661CD79
MRDDPLENMTLGDALARRAESHQDKTFLEFQDATFTFGEVDEKSNQVAQGLLAAGVTAGGHVAVMLPNGPEIVWVTFALARIGAVAVPVNTAFHGAALRNVLAGSDCTALIVDSRYRDRLPPVTADLPGMRLTIVCAPDGRPAAGGGTEPEPPGGETVEWPDLMTHGAAPPEHRAHPADLLAIMYTSGSTGPAKGALVPHALALACAQDVLKFVNVHGEKVYCPLPLFHAAGMWDGVLSALLCGGTVAVAERFSASKFWDDVRRFDARIAISVFSILPILLKQPPSARDKEHSLKLFYTGKSLWDGQLRERFGVRSVESYTSTEAGVPLAGAFGNWRPGSCGQVNAERFEAAVVDDRDRPLPAGRTGELVLRPRQPHIITGGYYGNFEATAHAFRNLWFHTGDRMRQDKDGYFYFVDRMADAIRRRGENVSAFDIELAVNQHAAVRESAAIGVPSELGEDDVKLAVVLVPDATVDHDELTTYCREALPAFMVPRYLEFVDALPRTATDKIAKHRLRALGDRGLTATTWDRERGDFVTGRPATRGGPA